MLSSNPVPYEALRSHFSKRIDLTHQEFESIRALFVPRKVKKRQFLLHEGEVCRFVAFVTKGCLRSYTIDDRGEEHIVQFAIEDWWIEDIRSFQTGTPTTYNIDALEDSEVLLIDKPSADKLFTLGPKIEHFFNFLSQNAMAALERRITTFLSMSAEEKYLDLLKTYPNLVQRISSRHISSYLGITPESLSRIRKELSVKK